MTSSDPKTSEFAYLVEFFEHLASRRIGSSDPAAPMDDSRSPPILEELEPVIKRLSTILGTSKSACESLGSRPERNATTSTNRTSAADDDDRDEEDDESLAKLPLGKRYPFTFKLMVHKLYRVDEWAKTVKEMLEKSKMEFRSLAEQETVMKEDQVEEKQNDLALANKDKNVVRFKVEVSNGSGRRKSVIGGRQRSQSVIVPGPKVAEPASPLPKSPGSEGQSEFRALKKRCVGRRKSMSGPMNGDSVTGRIGGSWVYEAAISSAEHSASEGLPAFSSWGTLPSPTTQTYFSSYQTLGSLCAPRKVPIMKRRVGSRMPRPLPLPFQQVTNTNTTDRISPRKRVFSAVDEQRIGSSATDI